MGPRTEFSWMPANAVAIAVRPERGLPDVGFVDCTWLNGKELRFVMTKQHKMWKNSGSSKICNVKSVSNLTKQTETEFLRGVSEKRKGRYLHRGCHEHKKSSSVRTVGADLTWLGTECAFGVSVFGEPECAAGDDDVFASWATSAAASGGIEDPCGCLDAVESTSAPV